MKNIIKVLSSLIISFIFICIVNTVVFARSFTGEITIEQNEIRAGDEVEAILSFNTFNDIKKGINSFKGKLYYDTNIFEKVTIDNMEVVNNWENLLFNEEINEFIAIHKAGSSQKQDVLKIKFKVKDDVIAGQTKIKVENLVASDGKRDITTEDLSVQLEVIENQVGKPEENESSNNTQSPSGNGQSNNSQTPADNETINNQQSASKSDSNKTSSENLNTHIDKESGSSSEKPSTNDVGIEVEEEEISDKDVMIVKKSTWSVLRLCLLIFLIILLIILFIIWKKGKGGKTLTKDKKNFILIFLIASITMLQLGSTVYAIANKGELSGDKNLDYLDVMMIQKHLIKLELLPEDVMEKADMNSDGMLTVTDLSFVIQKIENTLAYDVEIYTVMDSYYIEKGENVDFKFYANVSHGAKITEVTLNGKEYSVEELGNNEYSVEVGSYDKAGIYEFKISEVKLDVNKKIKVLFNEKIEVLKDTPIIKDYETKDLINEGKVQVIFNIEDIDKAMNSGSFKVVTADGVEILTKEVMVGNNIFDVEVEEGKDYKAIIEASYNRDTDTLEHEIDNSGRLLIEKDIKLVVDYQLTLSNIATYDSENNQKNIFAKGEEIILGFESKNATNFIPENAVINGVSYPVEVNGNKYVIKLEAFKDFDEKEFKIEEIQLSNGKKLEVKDNNTVKVTIEKNTPSVSDVTMEEDVDSNKINISFKVIDEDKALKKLKMILSDDKGNVILEEEVTGDEYKKEVSVGPELRSNYTLKILGDYNVALGNAQDVINKELYTETKEAKTRVIVEDSQIPKTYLEKGGDLKLTYTIKSNRKDKIKKIIVSNIEVPVNEESADKYSTTIQVGQNAGKQDITLTSVIFEDGSVAKVNKSDAIEILKDKPKANNFKSVDDYNNSQIKFSFNIDDIDNSFMLGKAQLIKKDGTIFKESDITSAGEYETTFDVVEKEEYNFKVIATYKRDEGGTQVINDEELLNRAVQLVINYDLKVNNLETYNMSDTKTSYMDRNTDIKLRFTSTNNTKFVPEKAIVSSTEYPVQNLRNNIYEVILNGFDSAGVKEIEIEKIILNNTKELQIDKDNRVSLEILKLKPSYNNFKYEELNNGNIKVYFDIIDDEQSIIKSQLIVNDGTSDIHKEDSLKVGLNEVEFKPNHNENYTLKVLSEYDLDTNTLDQNSNVFTDEKILEENITFSAELIQMKDISEVSLYKKNSSNKVELIKEVDVQNFNSQDYIAKVVMKDMSNFYSELKSGTVDNNNDFILELKYDNAVHYNGDIKSNAITVTYGKVVNDIAKKVYFEDIINTIKNDPTAEITLTQDLDAVDVSSNDSTIISREFQGKINGNGYKIKNLNKPLFNSIKGATIENLIIDGATVNGSNGILSNTVSEGKISNVHIRNSNITANHSNGVGTFAGATEGNTIIEESSVSNSTIKGSKHLGGFIGWSKPNSNTTIKNSYISGTIDTTSDSIAGMVGKAGGPITIENSYSNVILDAKNGTSNRTGVVGNAGGVSVTLRNVISLADRPDNTDGYRVVGSGKFNITNTFEISESKLKSNANINGIDAISKNNINDDFLSKTLNWDSKIWNISNNNSDNMPILKNEVVEVGEVVEPENKEIYIPDIKRLKNLDNYDIAKEIAYHNMYILMPFYDAKLYVDYGNRIDVNHILNTTKIKTVMPYDANGKMIVGLNSDNYNSISKIKVIFEDEQIQEYDLEFKRKLGDVATYKIDSLGIGYTYNKFILNTSISLVNELITAAEAMDYNTVIAAVTPETESRLYVDYYNESVKPKLREVIINILQSEPEYNIYMDNEILKEKIKTDLLLDNQLEKLLYTYNYYDKWYNFKLGKTPLSDVIFFNVNNMVNKNYDIRTIVKNTIEQPQSVRETKKTIDFYNNVIKPQTNNLAIKEFLEYHIKIIAGYDNASDWFSDTFKGMLKENAIEGKEDEIDYRVWTLMNKRNDHVLPILSAPQEDMYIISMPTQVVIGSLNRYSEYLNGNKDEIKNKIDEISEVMSKFYSTSAAFINNSSNILNSKVHIQYDTRFNFPVSGNQESGSTQDPVIKWVYEALGKFSASNATGAYANGTDMYWVVNSILEAGNHGKFVFTHETAHNQDAYYFYESGGRRAGTGAEYHANGNIAQEFKDGTFVMNLINNFSMDDNISSNFNFERIKGKDKIYSYYKEFFETHYVLDYLTAQAFLKLTSEQKSKVAAQVSYIDNNDNELPDQSSGGNRTKYAHITAKEFEDMNLQDMEDLWDNKITLREELIPTNQYNEDSHYQVNWYQPHNDGGAPDPYSFKRLGFEMLGVAGYTDGYVIYRSNRSKNDLEALRAATGDDNITWKEYKLKRYENVENNLKNIPYFDTDKIIDLYHRALINDANKGNRNETNKLREILYGFIKRVTNDFTEGTIYDIKNVKDISTAEELIQAISTNSSGSYRVIADLDFSNIDVSNQEAYVMNKFYGMIDGNGHKFNGLTKPLMKNTIYSHIKNLIIESPNYTGDSTASLIIEAKNTIIGDIEIKNSNISLPFVKTISGALKEYGKMENISKENEISSIDDLKAINDDTTGFARKYRYKLTTDIDASSITSQNPIITGEFSGEINGNGYKIHNLNTPLIENLTGSITNIKIEDVTINNNRIDNLGAISKTAKNARVSDVTLNNVTVNGRNKTSALIGAATNTNINNVTATNVNLRGNDYIGTLTGELTNGNIENIELDSITVDGQHSLSAMIGSAKGSYMNKITATNINVTGTGFYGGSLVGRIYSTTVSNVIASGELTITKTSNGGVIGVMRDKSTLENVYGNVVVNRPQNNDNRDQNAGLVGAFEAGKGTIKNSVSMANVASDVYKVISGKNPADLEDIKNQLQNVYENTNATGLSNINQEGNIQGITLDTLKDPNFYISTLNWDSNIWDFTEVVNGGLPKIKHK